MYLTDLADKLRAEGLSVTGVGGWRTRGRGPMSGVRSVMVHHTGGAKSGNAPTLKLVTNGRKGKNPLAGPLCHIHLARDGRITIVAAGRANHAGQVSATKYENAYSIGIEAENTGLASDPWPRRQYDAYVRLVAALCKAYKIPVADVVGHREAARPKGRKIDPTYSGAFKSMARFRKDVSAAMKPKPAAKPKPKPSDLDWIKIVSANLGNANAHGKKTWDARKAGIVNELASTHADVIVLQEAGDAAKLKYLDAKFSMTLKSGIVMDYVRLDQGDKNRQIYRRKSTTDGTAGGLELMVNNGGKDAYFQWARLRVDGSLCLIYNVHLPSPVNAPESVRVDHVAQVAKHSEDTRARYGLSRSRVVFAGDWNTSSASTFKPLTDLGYARADLVAKSASNAGLKTFTGWGKKPVKGEPIDLVFVHEKTRPVRKTNVRYGHSDHGFPVSIIARQK